MFSKILRVTLVAIAAVVATHCLTSTAEPSKDQRLAIIKGLLLKGVVGENNQGYLEFRGPKQAEEVVNTENSVRKKEYVEVAKKVGKSPQEAGQTRARQNADNAPAGSWIQDANGNWKKK